MKLQVGVIVALALAAGPAAAQTGFNNGAPQGPFGFGTKPTTPPKPDGSYVPSYAPPPAAKPRSPGFASPPTAPGFKPYEPYKPGWTYASPKQPSYGAKPCETSVYVNACEGR